MPIFIVPIAWTMTAEIEIEADNQEDAIRKVNSMEITYDTGERIKDSMEIIEEGIQLLNASNVTGS